MRFLRVVLTAVAATLLLMPVAQATVCSFGLLTPTEHAAGIKPHDIASADFNGDGYIDIAVVNNQTANITVRLGAAGGTFGNPMTVDLGATTQNDIAAGDFDADGKVDLVVAIPYASDMNTFPNTVRFLKGNGDGTFTRSNGMYMVLGQNPEDFTTGDFDGDGKTDVAVTAGANGGTFALFLAPFGTTSGIYQTVIPELTTNGIAPSAITSGDFDSDGKRDIAVSVLWGEYPSQIQHTAIYVFYGQGNGHFTPADSPLAVTEPRVNAAMPASLASTDFDGDGRDDIVAAYRAGDGTDNGTWLSVLLSRNGRTFAAQQKYAENSLGQVWSIRAADVDSDGNADIVAATSRALRVYRGHGDGTLAIETTVDISAFDLNVTDVDRDGGQDIVATDFVNEVARVLLNTCAHAALSFDSSANPADEGDDFSLTAEVIPPATAVPTGTITIRRGSDVLATGSLTSSLTLSAAIRDLVPGAYLYTATYSGDSRFSPSLKDLTQIVQTPAFGPPPRLNAVSHGGAVALSWVATAGVHHYEIWRTDGSGWQQVPNGISLVNQFLDPAPPDGVYLYKVRGVSATGAQSDFSNPDLATTVVFSDDPAAPGVTTIKLAHLAELRSVVDRARALLELGPYAWADHDPSVVLAAHWTELRTAAGSLRSSLLLRPSAFTDAPLISGDTVIRAMHVNELREAIR